MNAKQMLELGQECGLETVSEAYSNVMLHWDAFFTYANHEAEITAFNDELKKEGLLVEVEDEGWFTFGDLTIGDALKSLNATLYVKAGRGY